MNLSRLLVLVCAGACVRLPVAGGVALKCFFYRARSDYLEIKNERKVFRSLLKKGDLEVCENYGETAMVRGKKPRKEGSKQREFLGSKMLDYFYFFKSFRRKLHGHFKFSGSDFNKNSLKRLRLQRVIVNVVYDMLYLTTCTHVNSDVKSTTGVAPLPLRGLLLENT